MPKGQPDPELPNVQGKPHLAFLDHRRAKFVEAYAQTSNGAQSARIAGYSDTTAKVQGSKLLKDERIQRAIAAERITLSGGSWGDTEVLAGLREEATSKGPGTSQAARVAALRAYGEALGLFKRPDLDALASLQRIEIVLKLPDGSTHNVAGAAMLKPLPAHADAPKPD